MFKYIFLIFCLNNQFIALKNMFIIKIFTEKLAYNTGPKVNTRNPNYKKATGDVQVEFFFILFS